MMSSAIRQNYLLPFSVLTANANLQPNHLYASDGGVQLVLTLPLAPPAGSIIEISNINNGFSLMCQGLEAIMISPVVSTPGPGGSVDCTDDGASITLRYEASNQIWVAISVVGQFDIF